LKNRYIIKERDHSYAKLNNYQKAIFCWEQVLKNDPGNGPAGSYLAHAKSKGIRERANREGEGYIIDELKKGAVLWETDTKEERGGGTRTIYRDDGTRKLEEKKGRKRKLDEYEARRDS